MTGESEKALEHREVGALWDANAEAWTTLTRLGYDKYRDHINVPAFMEMLPDVAGLRGLDVGCGEGHNTRLVAQQGAKLTAIDIARRFLDYAQAREVQEPHGIAYLHASAIELPFDDASFAFVMATMSMMDVPDQDRAVHEVARVLQPGGFFQFSILHPCFMTPRFKWVLDEAGQRVALECGDYFSTEQGTIEEWIFGSAPDESEGALCKISHPALLPHAERVAKHASHSRPRHRRERRTLRQRRVHRHLPEPRCHTDCCLLPPPPLPQAKLICFPATTQPSLPH